MLRLLLLASLVGAACAACGCPQQSATAAASAAPKLPVADPDTGLVEGDMLLSRANYLELLGLRNTVSRLWPGGVLYYSVSNGDAAHVASALQKLQDLTDSCVRFERRTWQPDYVDVVSGNGCWSAVGRRGGRQALSLQLGGCYSDATIQHEFLHALGFYHEQSRQDRDRHITVHWQKIKSSLCNNFWRSGRLPSDFPDYDINSVMHYTSQAFSCDRYSWTMSTKTGGYVGGFFVSKLDVMKIKRLYSC